jgi:hypothetical protein
MTKPEAPGGSVEIAGLQLTFELENNVVKVWDVAADRWLGNAYMLDRSDGPLLNPSYAYRDRLGKSAGDRHGSADRDQIAKYAKEFRDGQTKKG